MRHTTSRAATLIALALALALVACSGDGPTSSSSSSGTPIALPSGSASAGGVNVVVTTNKVVVPESPPGTGSIEYASLALDTADLPAVAYYDGVNKDLRVIRCGNPTCSSGTPDLRVASAGDVGTDLDLALDGDRPVIIYRDRTNARYMMVRCGLRNCQSGGSLPPNAFYPVVGTCCGAPMNPEGGPVSLVLDPDNRPVFAQAFDGGSQLTSCSSAGCNTLQNLVPSRPPGGWVSVGLSKGLPVFSHIGVRTGSSTPKLVVFRCLGLSRDCGTENTRAELYSFVSPPPQGTALAIDPSGFPVVAFPDNDRKLRLVHCADVSCVSTSRTTSTPADATTSRPSMVLDARGFAVIAYIERTYERDPGRLAVLHCGNAACSSNNVLTHPDAQTNTRSPTIVLNSDGFPVISLINGTDGTLRLLVCRDANCSGSTSG
jgi:hypothetical protein